MSTGATEVRRRRTSLVTRTVLLVSAVATITAVMAGLASYPLVRNAAEQQARADLVRLADLTATALDRGDTGRRGEPLPRPLIAALQAEQITGYLLAPGAEAPVGVSVDAMTDLMSGLPVSTRGETPQGPVLVEGRPLIAGGAVVLLQPLTVAGVEAADALRRLVAGLLVGLLVAVPVGYWAARRIIRPLRAARDAANQMAAGSRDVTLVPEGPIEIADIADSLNHLNAALVTSEARQRDFLLSVSHELRTPLTAVKGYAEALADGVIDADDVARTGTTVALEAARLDRLVSDLLDLARLGAIDFRITPVEVDLAELGRDAGEVWSARAEREGVRAVIEVPDTPVLVETDPLRVRQIIDNLAENALRVCPPDSQMVLAIRAEEASAVVEVRDSGPGLTDEDRSVAFEPGALHERYRGVRPVGTGLGLALVGRLARGLGGTSEVGVAPEGGARFTVRLPFPT